MKSEVYSSDGFMIDQKKMDDVPFGRCTCKNSGCGCIAAFNLLKAERGAEDWDNIFAEFQKGLLLGGRWGVMPFKISRFLKKRDFSFQKMILPKRAAQAAEKSKSGILLYCTGHSLHYVAFYNCGGGVHRFLNADCGNDRHLMTMDAFLKKHSKLPFVCLWYNK